MVNGPLPPMGMRSPTTTRNSARPAWKRSVPGLGTMRNATADTFAQILGKLYFFNLRENLRHILFDYGEKRSCTTNGAFKSAC
jgi:hypothetical protein